MIVNLTQAEINHILFLICDNKEQGFYIGNEEQYWNRSKRIEQKLSVK
ncbi:MAG: hypothetical protein ACFFC1_10505 [Promethearchaeota archaeon]